MYSVIIQLAAKAKPIPKKALLRKWAETALCDNVPTAEMTLRIVDVPEMTALNSQYRHKSGPTNVLSFPFSLTEDVALDMPILGDVVICAEVVNREAKEQRKTEEAHWAHMVVHGIYHLLGYDHENDEDASIMEALEIKTLDTLGFANPYQTREDI